MQQRVNLAASGAHDRKLLQRQHLCNFSPELRNLGTAGAIARKDRSHLFYRFFSGKPMNQQTNAASRLDQLLVDELPADVVALCKAIDELPAQHRGLLGPVLERVIDSTKRRRRILGLVQDALGQLRLDMKYLMFDLEATRRERDELREQADGI